MKKANSIFGFILGYYALINILPLWKSTYFLKDVFVAPLYLLLPTGIGLLIFSVFGTHKRLLQTFTRSQLVVSATFLGFTLITLVYMQANIASKEILRTKSFGTIFLAINILSLAGFYRTREILAFDENFKAHLKTLAVLFPLGLVAYYFYFIHFSPFPLRDLFQDVHFMKGALEFSRHRVLNIATGDTYIPLIQVLTGLLNHFYSYDVLNSQWILPAHLFLFHYLCLHCFYASFIKDPFTRLIALGLTIISFKHIFLTNNNELLVSLSLVLFSLLVSSNRGKRRAIPVLIELAGLGAVLIILFLYRQFPASAHTFLPYLAGYLLVFLTVALFKIRRLLAPATVLLLLLLTPQLHRISILVIPLVLTLYAIYFLSFQWNLLDSVETKYSLLRKMLLYGLICTLTAGALGVLAAFYAPSATVYIERLMDPIIHYLVGRRVHDYIGILGTLGGVVRIAYPALLLLLLLLGVQTLLLLRSRGVDLSKKYIEPQLSFIIFALASAAMLAAILMTSVTHIHRVTIFFALMVISLIAFLIRLHIDVYFKKEEFRRVALIIPAVILIYTVAARVLYTKSWYAQSWKTASLPNPYIPGLYPIIEVAVALMLILLVLMVVRRTRSLAWLSMLILLFSGLAADRFMVLSKFYVYPYGHIFPEARAISHYSLAEFRAARHLDATHGSKLLTLFSDPYSLAIFEAVTGINGFYSFSNIGLMNENYTKELKSIMRLTFPEHDIGNNTTPGKQAAGGPSAGGVPANPTANVGDLWSGADHSARNNAVLDALDKFFDKNPGAIPEVQYLLNSKNRLGFRPSLMRERIIWVVTEKTVNWAYGEVGYYPQNGQFSPEYITRYIDPYFEVLYNDSNKIFLLRIK